MSNCSRVTRYFVDAVTFRVTSLLFFVKLLTQQMHLTLVTSVLNYINFQPNTDSVQHPSLQAFMAKNTSMKHSS